MTAAMKLNLMVVTCVPEDVFALPVGAGEEAVGEGGDAEAERVSFEPVRFPSQLITPRDTRSFAAFTK